MESNCKACNEKLMKNDDTLSVRGYGKVHTDCYKQRLIDKYGDIYANNKIKELIEERDSKKQLKKKKNLEKLNGENKLKQDKSLLIDYIIDIYNFTIPKQLFIKLASINNGTYKGLKEPISYEDLLCMFTSKQKTLTKIYQDNIRKGNEFDSGYKRFCYDLAVIINKYDGYKKWKEKQKIIQSETKKKIEEENKEIKIDYSKIKADIKETNDLDLEDIIDDIY